MTPFERYVIRKEELAAEAWLSGFYTLDDATAGRSLVAIGSAWTRRLFDGDFYRRAGSASRPSTIARGALSRVEERNGLLRAGVVRDVYLTTSPVEAGEPGTPFYEGTPPTLTRVLAKVGRGAEAGVRFEHFLVDGLPI